MVITAMQQDSKRILLVEDNPADVRLTQEVLRESRSAVALDVVRDGEQALAFLRRQGEYADARRPDIVLLDLNLPRKDGREVLADLKTDPELQTIPVIMLTTSKAEHDVADCYAKHVNAYIIKPVDLDEFVEVMEVVERHWLRTVRLPPAH
ncbi:MAG: response regulator [Salinisphaeraceae bacterium]|jgi:CheY-like chemotaxis protein|nr:response regulator [Salinisphaeraceae bacterium]